MAQEPDKELQTIMQNLLTTGFQRVNERLSQITAQMKEMKTEISEAKQHITEVKTKTQDLEEKVRGTDARVNQTEETLEAAQKNQKQNDNRLIMLEMERASRMLRFQNVSEKEGEDLEILMSKALAAEIGMEAPDFYHCLEATFRVNTAYARRNKLPKEIHVRFTKKSITGKV